MFCPNCRTEYMEGYYTCADCQVSLVESLEPIPEPEMIEYEEILTTFNHADVALIKSILDTTDIVYYFHGENFTGLEPVTPTRLLVKKDQVPAAKELIEGFDLNYAALDLPEDE